MTTDQISEITIKLNYPKSLILTDEQLAHTPFIRYRCTIEVQPIHRKDIDPAEVKAVRVLGMKDADTGKWLNYCHFNATQKKAFKEATLRAVLDILQVKPRRSNVRWAVPDGAFIEEAIDVD